MAEKATMARVPLLGNVVEGATAIRALLIRILGILIYRSSKGRPNPASDSCETTDGNDLSPADEDCGGGGNGIQGFPGGCLDRMCGASSVSNGGPGPSNGDHD